METNNEPDNAATQPDPVADRSLSGPLVVASLLLVLSLVWGLYDELFAERPWKYYQRHFAKAYDTYLKKLGPQQAAADKAARQSEEFQKIDRQVQAAEQEIAPKVQEIETQVSAIRMRLAAMKSPFQDTRAKIAALTYELDHSDSANAKNSIRGEIGKVKKGPFRIAD